MGKPLGEHPLGSPRWRWEDNIKMHLTEMGWRMGGGMNDIKDHVQ
jgi:hypothetical protein